MRLVRRPVKRRVSEPRGFRRAKAAVALGRYIGEERGARASFARLLEISEPTLHDYLRGYKRPRQERRLRIQILTKGQVRADDWMLPHERAIASGRATHG